MTMNAKEEKILAGLADAFDIPATNVFEILRAAAEALGCRVADDGTTTTLPDEEDDDEEPATKRVKRDGSENESSEDAEGGSDGDDGGNEEEDDNDHDDDDDDEEEHQGEEQEEREEEEQPLIDLKAMAPVGFEDSRGPEDVERLDVSSLGADDGEQAMQWLLSPLDLETFLDMMLEQRPALARRVGNPEYNRGIMTSADIEALLCRPQGLKYGLEVDVTKYVDGERHTLNYNATSSSKGECCEEGAKADADVVLTRFREKGCSIRLLHPQRFLDSVWRLLAALEGFWGSPVGSNAYLTPAGSQGFAPHWDDIDAFVLQLEGKKRWRLFAPTDPSHVLPRHSSRDFAREELGEVVFDVILQPGDMLYMPRGTIHEAEAVDDLASLHLTISANQQRTWASLLEELLPRAVRVAATKHRALRQTVPKDFAAVFGSVLPSAGEEAVGAARHIFAQHANMCWQAIADDVDLDWGADHWASEFMLRRLPPPPAVIDPTAACGSNGAASYPSSAAAAELNEDSYVEMVHPGLARVMLDEEGEVPVAVVCHPLSNSRDAHAEEDGDGAPGGGDRGGVGVGGSAESVEVPPQMEFPAGCAETLAELLEAEGPVAVREVEQPDEEGGVSALELAQALVPVGLLRAVAAPVMPVDSE